MKEYFMHVYSKFPTEPHLYKFFLEPSVTLLTISHGYFFPKPGLMLKLAMVINMHEGFYRM